MHVMRMARRPHGARRHGDLERADPIVGPRPVLEHALRSGTAWHCSIFAMEGDEFFWLSGRAW